MIAKSFTRRLLSLSVGSIIIGSSTLYVWHLLSPDRRMERDPKHYYTDWRIRLYTSLPWNFVSTLVGSLARLEIPVSLRRPIYGTFARAYDCRMEEAKEEDLRQYPTFSAFFNRELKNGVRPISHGLLVSPADGTVLHFGKVVEGRVEFVKGNDYELQVSLCSCQPRSLQTMEFKILICTRTRLAYCHPSTPAFIALPPNMGSYNENERELIAAARANVDRDAGNEELVRIVATKAGIPLSDILYLKLDKDGHFTEKTDAGIYNLIKGGSDHDKMTLRRICSEGARDGTCKRAFKFLPVKDEFYGFFLGEHDHPPHVNYAFVETFRLLLALRDEGDEEELANFQHCHEKVQALMTKPGVCDEKYLCYAVIKPGISEAAYREMSTAERFESVGYLGQSKTSIVDRMRTHSQPRDNLFVFTNGGATPTFLVVHTEQELSAGEAAFQETRLIALVGSDHRIHNTEQGAKWRDLTGVTREEGYRATSVFMANLLDGGLIYECNWSSNLKRNEAKKPKPDLVIDTAPEAESPVGRKRKRATPSVPPTPVSALDRFHFSPSPGSATVRTSAGHLDFDGTLEDLRAKRAELDKALNEEEERIQRQEKRDDGA